MTIAALVVLILCTAISAYLFLLPARSNGQYQELIEEGEQYLFALDYNKAEEYFLKAREIEPKKLEPYELLFETYLEMEEEEKANAVVEDARLILLDVDFTQLNAAIETKRNEYKELHPEFTVVNELGDLDRAPIDVGNLGWIIQKNGRFGLLKPDGTLVSDTNKRSYARYDGEFDEPYVCTYGTETEVQETLPADWTELDRLSHCSNMGGTDGPGVFAINDQGKLDYMYAEGAADYDTGYRLKLQNDNALIVPKNPSLSSADAYQEVRRSLENKEFYIYVPASEKTYGPYGKDEIPTLAKFELNSSEANMFKRYSQYHQVIDGPFYVKDGSSFSVLNAAGTRQKDGFDQVEIVSDNVIGVFEKGVYTLLDENLEKLYSGKFESGSKTINGATPVKTKGVWKLVHFGSDSREDQNENPTKPAEEKPEAPVKEETASYSELAGQYRSNPGGSTVDTLILNPDGSFQIEHYNSYHNAENPEGIVYFADLTGSFEPVSSQNGYETVRLSGIRENTPSGTEEIVNGARYYYRSAEMSGYPEGDVYTIYPAGTPVSDLDEFSAFLADSQYGQASGGVLTVPVITNGINTFALNYLSDFRP